MHFTTGDVSYDHVVKMVNAYALRYEVAIVPFVLNSYFVRRCSHIVPVSYLSNLYLKP